VLSTSEYGELGVPYDLAGLRGAARAEFRLLHLHGEVNGGIERYAQYPVQIVDWSEVESSVTLVEGAQALGGKFVMGGIAEDRSGPADAATKAWCTRRLKVSTKDETPSSCSVGTHSAPTASTFGRLDGT
jgi:hypothetical protein